MRHVRRVGGRWYDDHRPHNDDDGIRGFGFDGFWFDGLGFDVGLEDG